MSHIIMNCPLHNVIVSNEVPDTKLPLVFDAAAVLEDPDGWLTMNT